MQDVLTATDLEEAMRYLGIADRITEEEWELVYKIARDLKD